MKNEIDLSWAAGIIDGEGSICITRIGTRPSKTGYYHCALVLAVKNTSRLMCEKLQQFLGGSFPRQMARQAPHHKIPYLWRVTGFKAHKAIIILEPYIVCKQEQVKLAKLFATTLKTRGYRLSSKDKDLQQKLRKQLSAVNRGRS